MYNSLQMINIKTAVQQTGEYHIYMLFHFFFYNLTILNQEGFLYSHTGAKRQVLE